MSLEISLEKCYSYISNQEDILRAGLIAVILMWSSLVQGGSVNNVYICHDAAIQVIDIATNLLIAPITVGDMPAESSVYPTGTKIYVPNFNSDNMSVIDTTTNLVFATITVGSEPEAIAIPYDGGLAYVGNLMGLNVSIIDTTSETVFTTITVGDGVIDVAISNDGAKLYGLSEAPSYFVIDTRTNTIIQQTSLPALFVPSAICPSLDGTKAYIVGTDSSNAVVINTSTDAIIATITVGNFSGGCGINYQVPIIFITNESSNSVSVIDTIKNIVIATISVGTSPLGAAFSPDGTRGYVTNFNFSNMSVIDVATFVIIATVTLPETTASFLFPATSPDYIANLGIEISSGANIFLTQKEFFNVLTWSTPSGAFFTTSRFKIYRDAALTNLIATLPATPVVKFEDHNRRKDMRYTYYIVGDDGSKRTSFGVASIITRN